MRIFLYLCSRIRTYNHMAKYKLFLITLLAVISLSMMGQSKFVTVSDGHFLKDGKPYYYVGTNFWYGAILGSEGQGGDRQRLVRELDLMKRMGIDNLRVLVGSDGERGVTTKVEPTLQVQPGVYNDTIPGNGVGAMASIWNMPVQARLPDPMRTAIPPI